jgi:molybdopterin-guanine dinucleotide biosynthesis protein
MAILVVGGHSRNIGKTSVMEGLIRGLQGMHWTAFKVTQFGHGMCSANGEPCDCVTAEHTLAVSEERSLESGTDTSRYLAAGAVRSLWVRTRMGDLAEAMPRIRKELERDPTVEDFKDSARFYLDRADAVLVPEGTLGRPGWKGVSLKLVENTPILAMRPPKYVTEEILSFVLGQLHS